MANRMKKMFFSWWLCLGSLVWLALFSQTQLSANWYGQAAPVVTPLSVTKIEPAVVDGHPGSRIRGYANIIRQCDYTGLEWFYQGETRDVKVEAFFRDPVKVRADGQSRWEALIVGVAPDRLDKTYGYALHKCGMLPIKTRFFDPAESLKDVELPK